MALRDYQRYGVDEAWEFIQNRRQGQHGLMLYPTGVGKSWMIATLNGEAHEMDPNVRICNLVHSAKLVENNSDTFAVAYPHIPFGVYCDDLGQKNGYHNITFATIQSIGKQAAMLGHVDLVYIDEAQAISEEETTLYRVFLAALEANNPDLVVIGFTATGYRMKQGKLTQGEGALFDTVVVDATDTDAFNWFIDEGYLIEPVPKKTGYEVSGESLRLSGGDFAVKQDQSLMNTDKINHKVVIDILENTQDRHCGMMFATGVDHCIALCDVFNHYEPGIATWVASRGITKKQAKYNLEAFQAGEYKWIVNNGILTTGFDHPPVDVIAIARHLMSPGLWVQIVGRLTRPLYAPGYDLNTRVGRLDAIQASYKHLGLVLDYCQNASRLGPINAPRVPKRSEKGSGDAPIRFCEDDFESQADGTKKQIRKGCGWMNPAGVMACKYCGEPFPRTLAINEKASTAKLIKKSNKIEPPPGLKKASYEWVDVDKVTYSIHNKVGSPPSLLVTYHAGQRQYRKWLCFEHMHFMARDEAKKWWRAHSDWSPPSKTHEALDKSDSLKIPRRINVNTASTLKEVHEYEF